MERIAKIFTMLSLWSVAMLISGLALMPIHAAMASSDVIKWKCETYTPVTATGFKTTKMLLEKIRERSNGKLDIEIFPAGTLVPAKEIFNAVKRGMLEMGTCTPVYYRQQIPLATIAGGLPFNFKEIWEGCVFWKVWGFEQMMKNQMAKHGLYFNPTNLTATNLAIKKPVRKLEDFKGLRLRSSGLLQKYFTSIGSAASYLPGGEMYTALASGVVDGAHWGNALTADSMGLYEVCKYHLDVNFVVGSYEAFLIRQETIDKLPNDLQKVLYSTLEETFWPISLDRHYKDCSFKTTLKEKRGVEIISLSEGEWEKMQKEAIKLWDDAGKKGPECAKAVEMLKEFNRGLGRLH